MTDFRLLAIHITAASDFGLLTISFALGIGGEEKG